MSRTILADDIFRIMNGYEARLQRLEQGQSQPRTAPIEFAAPGGAPDATIKRIGPGSIEITGGYRITGNLTLGGSLGFSGDGGVTADAFIYRTLAGAEVRLQSDSPFNFTQKVRATGGLHVGGAITFGSAGSATEGPSLYYVSATEIRTDAALRLGSSGTLWGPGTSDAILYQNPNQDVYVNARVIRGRGTGSLGDGMYINYGASTGAGSNAQPIRFYVNGSTSEKASIHTNGMDVDVFRCGYSQAHGTSYASWSHRDRHSDTLGYCMLQTSGGTTFLNGRDVVNIRYQNNNRIIVGASNVEFYAIMRMLNQRGSTWSWDAANLELRSQGAGGYGASVTFHSPGTCAPQLTGHTDNRFYLMDSGGSLTGVYGSFFSTSGEEFKRNFRDVDKADVLRRMKTVPVRKFDWKEQRGLEGQIVNPPRPGIGPTAQEFTQIFPETKGDSALFPDSAISVADALGVLMAGMQGLIDRVEAVETRIPPR